MFRLEGKPFKPKKTTANIILMNGGAGDHMASLVAINYMIERYTWMTYLVWVPDYMLGFACHVLPKDANVGDYTSMAKFYDRDLPTKTTQWDGVVSPMKTSCLDYAFLKLCDEKPSIKDMNYLKIKQNNIDLRKFNLPEKYVVITTAYTAEVREFPAKEANKVAYWLIERGINIVYLGQKATKTGSVHVIEGKLNQEIDFDLGLNLIDKTTLLEAAGIMGKAMAVVGVDNGLLHVAGCTDVPIVGGFTTVTPELRMPVRNNILGHNYYPVIPDATLGCKFCQVKTNFLYGHDYKYCMYKDNLCTKQMTAAKFITQLEKICVK